MTKSKSLQSNTKTGKSKLIVIAGGGSGGHIYPGIAIAKALLKLDPQLEIRFVGTDSGLETKIVPKEGFKLHFIRSGKLNMRGNIFLKLTSLFRIFFGFFDSIFLLFKLRPFLVLGVGGYASGPFVLTSSLLGFSTAIWEPNAMPGLANRWLSRFVDRCFVVFSEAQNHLKNKNIFVAGMPIREEIEKSGASTFKTFSNYSKFNLLLVGGSQGARVLNVALSDCILQNPEIFQGISVIHQTGSVDFDSIQDKYKNAKSNGLQVDVQAHEFLYDMPERYKWADLVVARAGASTLAEIAAYGLVPILVPLTLADDHQLKNAEALVNARAGTMILQKELTPRALGVEILQLKQNLSLREEYSKNIRFFCKPLAAESIAKEILSS